MLEIYERENYRRITDNLNGRIWQEEWKCHVCGQWILDEQVIWALENGQLDTINGHPYCDDCLPEEK